MNDTERLDLIIKYRIEIRDPASADGGWIVLKYTDKHGYFILAEDKDLRSAIDRAIQQLKGFNADKEQQND